MGGLALGEVLSQGLEFLEPQLFLRFDFLCGGRVATQGVGVYGVEELCQIRGFGLQPGAESIADNHHVDAVAELGGRGRGVNLRQRVLQGSGVAFREYRHQFEVAGAGNCLRHVLSQQAETNHSDADLRGVFHDASLNSIVVYIVWLNPR